jgi:hypothetical protein
MRIKFDDLFRAHPDGSYTLKAHVRFQGALLGPWLSFRPGVVFLGLDIAEYVGRELEVEPIPQDALVITAVYPDTSPSRLGPGLAGASAAGSSRATDPLGDPPARR